MEETNSNSSTITGTKESMPDWKEIMDALGTEDLLIFESYIAREKAGERNGRVEMSVLVEHIMEALGDRNVSRIGVRREDGHYMDSLFHTITRRIKRDNLFDMTVMEIVREKSNLIEIQHQIACQLGLRNQEQQKKRPTLGFFDHKKKKVVNENKIQLSNRIRAQPKMLFILRNLHTTLDLAELGIPLDVDQIGCKVIITSESEDILSKMTVQRTFDA